MRSRYQAGFDRGFKKAISDLEPEIVRLKAEVERLQKIEDAATAWRRSLEGDDWTIEMIEHDSCRPGIAELMRLIRPVTPQHRENEP